jgi:SOS-response transcriptional repressor LexA
MADKWDEIGEKAWNAILTSIMRMRNEENFPMDVIANKVGVNNRSTIHAWLNKDRGSKDLAFPDMLRYLSNLGYDVADFIPISKIKRIEQNAPEEYVFNKNLTYIPVYDFAGAGPEFSLDSLESFTRLPVLEQYYRKGLFSVQVFGNSMEPTIRDGAFVGVMPYEELVEGAIYLIWRPYFGKLVKRVISGNDELILRSDNPKYEDIHLQYEGHDKVIIGRVKWIWQEC